MIRWLLSFVIGTVGVAAAVTMAPAQAQQGAWTPPLTVVSFGGAYTRSQMLAFVRPYRQASGQWVEVEQYNGGLDEIRAQVESLNVKWDVVALELADAVRGCNEGLLETIDPAILPPGPGGGAAADDFLEGALQPCAVGIVVWSTVVAYDADRYPESPPSTL